MTVATQCKANAERDREIKLKLYSRRDVQECWIADWQKKTIDIYMCDGAELQLSATLTITDTLTSALLPDFACPVERLFEL